MKPVSIVVREDAMVPLDRWLATELTRAVGRPVPRGLTRKAILKGLVTVGGRIVRDSGLVLRRGPSVFVRNLDWIPVAEPSSTLAVLFEDEWLIAADKPAGLPTHETADAARPSLTALVECHVGRRVFVHHRLDAGTSGVVLFAKAREANAPLSESFADRQVDKTYVALVQRPAIEWPKTMSIDSPIAILKNGTARPDSGGLPALTRIRVLGMGRDRWLVEARPVSGRKHQVRVHLASAGAPIIGDTRYGSGSINAPRLMLHAERLVIEHPITGKQLVITSPRPPAFAVSGGVVNRSTQPRRLGADPQPAGAASVTWPADGRRLATPSHTRTKPRRPHPGSTRGSRR